MRIFWLDMMCVPAAVAPVVLVALEDPGGHEDLEVVPVGTEVATTATTATTTTALGDGAGIVATVVVVAPTTTMGLGTDGPTPTATATLTTTTGGLRGGPPPTPTTLSRPKPKPNQPNSRRVHRALSKPKTRATVRQSSQALCPRHWNAWRWILNEIV